MNKLYAFESWINNGKVQVSALYEGDEASSFINDHGLSGTFKQLHVFQDKVTAETSYIQLRDDIDANGVSMSYLADDGVIYPDDTERTAIDDAMDNCENYNFNYL